ncbi:MAG: hypothetical protein KI790_05610 [Cyclobacteriaceae bacterium]|nr:hypothetical protein [Cyclobacteriaceae bacterium HetDA_MAG_MS6]
MENYPTMTNRTKYIIRVAAILIQVVTVLCFVLVLSSGCEQRLGQDEMPTPGQEAFNVELSAARSLLYDKPQKALAICDDVISKADKQNIKLAAGKAKWYKAFIYDDVEPDISKAYFFYNDALKDILETNDAALKMKIYTNLGILYRTYGQYESALDSYESALEYEGQLSIKQRSDLYFNYAVALKETGDSTFFYQAEKAFTKSLDLAESIEDKPNMARVNNQIGLMYRTVQNYDMSRIAYNNTIRAYASDPKMIDFVGKAYHGIGVTYMEEDKNSQAISAFEKALSNKKDSKSIFVTKYDLGTVQMRAGLAEQAIMTWKEALNEKHNMHDRQHIQIYSDLTDILAKSDRLSEAVGYARVYQMGVQSLLADNEKYKAEGDKILFEEVVQEYAEFNSPVPFYKQLWFILLLVAGFGVILFTTVNVYVRTTLTKGVSDAVTKIQTEFHQLKVD